MSSPDIKNLTIFKENVQPDTDYGHLMCTEQGLSDDNDCTWLSSGLHSSSFLSREELRSLDNLEMDYLLCQESMDSTQKIFRRSGTCASLLDLEREDAGWDREEMEALGPDFPSPSYGLRGRIRTRSPSLLGFSPASPGSVFQLSPAGNEGDEPLFWPFNRRSYSELQGNYLGISPRASLIRVKRRSSSNSIQIRVERSKEEVSRRGAARGVVAIRRGASRLSRARAAAQPAAAVGRRRSRHQLNSVRKKPGVNRKVSMVQWLLEFEAGYFQIFLAGGMSVEALVGLEEFDGH